MSERRDTISGTLERLFGAGEMDSTQVLLFLLDNMIWPILLLTFVGFAVQIPSFLTAGNIRALLFGSAALSALVLGESLCLLSGHFDLSVGAIAGFSAIFTGIYLTEWFPNTPGWVAILLILSIGAFIGLINGASIAYLGVNPFLQTLAFLIIFSGGVVLLSTSSMANLPSLYLFVGGGQVFGRVPFSVLLMIALYTLAGVWLKYSRTGRAIYSVGGDKDAAEQAGINVEAIIILVYVLSGTLSALGGLLYTGYLGVAAPTIGQNDVFPAFASAVIGGISLFGGRGKIVGAGAGVLLLGTIEAGLVLMQVDPTAVDVVNGFVLLLAIYLYTLEEQFRERLLAT